jgi:hypothetical protein
MAADANLVDDYAKRAAEYARISAKHANKGRQLSLLSFRVFRVVRG